MPKMRTPRCGQNRTPRSSPPDKPARSGYRGAAGASRRVDLPFQPAYHRQSLAKVSLRVPRIMAQLHKHLTLTLALRQHVILDDGQTAAVAVLVAQTLEGPLRGVPLLRRPPLVPVQHPANDPDKGIELRTGRRSAPRRPASGPLSVDRSRTDAPSRRLIPLIPTAQRTLAYSSAPFIPQPCALSVMSIPPPAFCSGTVG